MATLGLFSPELVAEAWFSPELIPVAWFDRTLVGESASVVVQDSAVYVSAFVGVETVGTYVVGDVAVVVQAVAPAEAGAALVVTDSGVFVEAVPTGESFGLYVVSDTAVNVTAFVGVESVAAIVVADSAALVEADVGAESFAIVYFVDDVAVLVDADVPSEVISTASEDPSVAVDVFVGIETATLEALDVSANVVALVPAESTVAYVVDDAGTLVAVESPAESVGLFVVVDDTAEVVAVVGVDSAAYLEAFDSPVSVEALVGQDANAYEEVLDVSAEALAVVPPESVVVPAAGVDDASVFVDVAVGVESASVTPAPGPSPQPRPILAGGTPLEDYEVGGYTLRELREVRESLLEEIIELPVREESAEDKREREAGEPRFSEFLKRIIEEPVKPKAEKKPTNWLPAVAIGAFLLGAWLATSGESEAFAGEEPEDDLLPDDLPDDLLDDGLDFDDDLLFEGETLPLQGPEHAHNLPELVESIEFRGEDFPEGEIPLESLSPEVADEELLRSIRQEIEEPEPKKAPKKRRAAKTKPLTREPETVLAYRPGRGRP